MEPSDGAALSVGEYACALRRSFAGSHSELIALMARMPQSITAETAPVLLGVLEDLFADEVDIEEALRPLFMQHFEEIADSLRAHLPERLACHLPEVAFRSGSGHTQEDAQTVDFFGALGQLIVEALVKASRHEIINAVNELHGEGLEDVRVPGPSVGAVLTYYLERAADAQCSAIVRHVAFLATPEAVPDILAHFSERPEMAGLFFLAARLLNPDVLAAAAEAACREKRFFKPDLVGALPDVDIERVIEETRDYNWEVLQAVVEARPDATGAVVAAFAEGRLKVSRKGFLERIAALDGYFAHYFTEMGLSDEEMGDLSAKSEHFRQRYYATIESEPKMAAFCRALAAQPEEEVLAFVKQNTSSPNFSLFLRSLCSAMRLSGDLKAYAVERLARMPEYFHMLITYLGIATVETLLEDFYQPEASIEALLRKYHPQELLIELHHFENCELAGRLIAECVRMERFCDRDWAFAMKTLEGVDTPIKMPTCLQLLKHRRSLSSQTLVFLKRSANRSVLRSQTAFAGLVSCLEYLGPSCVQVLEAMGRDEALACLRESRAVYDDLREFLRTRRGDELVRYRKLSDYLSWV
ncbi:symplekin [Pancytospora philotis]|nr:symplekin [Pancytospora philotis]KAI4291967.1 symplekin [Pancytospora philotis]